MAAKRPGIRRPRVRSPMLAQAELHQLMAPKCSPNILTHEYAWLPRPSLMDRFSAQVRSLGSRLLRFRAPRKGRA